MAPGPPRSRKPETGRWDRLQWNYHIPSSSVSEKPEIRRSSKKDRIRHLILTKMLQKSVIDIRNYWTITFVCISIFHRHLNCQCGRKYVFSLKLIIHLSLFRHLEVMVQSIKIIHNKSCIWTFHVLALALPLQR